jgi:transcriptional regulator with XRE-family HTH domain
MSVPSKQTAFGANLFSCRQRARLSQADLAKCASLSVGIVQALEQGVRRDPRLSTVLRLARALDVPINRLAESVALADLAGADADDD